MANSMRYWRSIVVVTSVVLVALLLAVPTVAAQDRNRDRERDRDAMIISSNRADDLTGKDYGEWGAVWWQQVAGTSAAVNPVLDPTGAQCHQGDQPGSRVFFLYGTFGTSVTRHCTVPPNQLLFFPLINTVFAAEGTVQQ